MRGNYRNRGTGSMLSEAVREPEPKPALGQSHDAYATVCVTLALAALFFFVGKARVESDWVGWAGFGIAMAALFAAAHYFKRSYGFSNQGYDELPRGAVASTFMCVIFGMQFIAPALYNQYFEEGIFGLSLICLTLAGIVVGPVRAALGKAPQTQPETIVET